MIVLVMGMGRSGTSLLMQVLQAAGVDCGSGWIAENENNPRGYFELRPVMNFNISLLQQASGDEDGLYPLPSREQIDKLRVTGIPINLPQHDFAMKDPRFSLTLPVWEPFLRDRDCRILFARRDPEAIAESMARAYHLDLPVGRRIIQEYTQRAEENIRRFGFPYVDIPFEVWFHDPEANLTRIESLIGRPLSVSLDQVLDASLYHCKGTEVHTAPASPAADRWDFITDTEKENLLALETLHPKLYQRIQTVIAQAGCTLMRQADGTFQARGCETSSWNIPEAFSPQTYPSVRYSAYQPTQHWLVVLGIDALCPISLQSKAGNALSPVLVIEPNIAKFYTYLKMHSYRDLFRQPNVYWFIGENGFEDVLRALNEELAPYFVLDAIPYPVFRDLSLNEYAERSKRFITVFQQSVRENFAAALKQSEAFFQKYTQSLSYKKALIIVPAASCWMVLGQGLAHGFRENGMEVIEYRVAFPPTKITPYETLRLLWFLRKTAPDFLVTLSHASDLFVRGIEHVPMKRVVWYVDEPDHLIQKRHGPYDDLYFSWNDFAERLQNRKGRLKGEMLVGAFPLPHVYQPSMHCEVGFVGSIEDQTAFRLQCPQDILAELDRIVDAKLARIKTPITALMESSCLGQREKEHLSRLLDPTGQKFGMTQEQTLILFLHQACIRNRRLSLLCALEGFDLRIYGNADWGGLLRDTPIEGAYQGRGLMYDECCRFYASCCISINIHPPYLHSGINQRDLDIPMCDGFLLSDVHLHAQGRMPAFFFPKQEIALYTDEAELRNQAVYFLDHPEERKHITQAAQARIHKDHLFSQRVKIILNHLREESEPDKP